jgi:hypothetical protein
MASAGSRYEDRLDGASNFSPWREHIALVLEEQGLWEITEGKVAAPVDTVQLATHNKKDVKARRIIVDGVKDLICLVRRQPRTCGRCMLMITAA